VDVLAEVLLRHVTKHPVTEAADYHLQGGEVGCLGLEQPIGPKDYVRRPAKIVFHRAVDDADAINASGVVEQLNQMFGSYSVRRW
jgi:hypothetical protein